MIKLVLSNDKADKLVFKLKEDFNLELKMTKISNREVLFLIDSDQEAIFFKVLNEIVDQENELWLQTFDGEMKLYPSNCLYFEVFDQETILTTDFYRTVYLRHTLNELEEMLANFTFQRISKSQIVNLKKITYIKPLLNSKIEITLSGNIKLVVNRSYLKAFKEALKNKGGL